MATINYEEFKKLFIREDGKKKNRILLDIMMSRSFREFMRENPRFSIVKNIRSMADLFYVCDCFVSSTACGAHRHVIFDREYRSDLYAQDGRGICVDGDLRGYRYLNVERNTIFKMKIGKMYKHLIESSEFGQALPESVKLFMCEEMTTKWVAYTNSKCNGYTLHVDDDFEKIYSSDYYTGDFHSCMTDGENYHFYENSVDAKAAYLTNRDDKIVARCIIYTKAVDLNGKIWRLAERQYSEECDDVLKRILIYSLIKGGHIDAYKKVGAGCHDPLLWMDINDNPIENAKFSIRCHLGNGDYVSYQDSFKWFDFDTQTAYNYNHNGCLEDSLSTTDDEYEVGNWDSWHEEYTGDDLVNVYYNGSCYRCSEDRLDDFIFVPNIGEYYHREEVSICPECNEPFVTDDGHYSEITGEYYCCSTCRDEAEERCKEE